MEYVICRRSVPVRPSYSPRTPNSDISLTPHGLMGGVLTIRGDGLLDRVQHALVSRGLQSDFG
jgi:hypothetical protein